MKSLLFAGALALVAAPAVAGPIGTGAGQQACAQVLVPGTASLSVCADIDSTGNFQYTLGNPIEFGGTDGFVIDALSFSGNTDPFISYTVGFTDNGAPTSLTVTFGSPIVAAAYTHATSSLDINLTGADGSSVSIAPLAPATHIGSGAAGTSYPGTSLGVDVGSACSGTGVVTCTPAFAESFFAPTTSSVLVATAAFQLSGGGDKAQLLGNVTIDTKAAPVPEPALPLLIGTALAALAARRHRRP